MSRKLLAKQELIIIVVILSVAILAYFFMFANNEDGTYARISVRNYPSIYLNLAEDTTFTLPQNPNVSFRVSNGAVAFTHSDCADRVCINMGYLQRVGQSAACLPNWVSLVILGPSNEDIDIVV